jgi:hypothetical protein
MTAPQRSAAQRMDALQHANEIRTKRASYKRNLKARRASIVEALLDPPEFLETAKVFELMLAVPKYGRVKTNKILQSERISPSKTLAGLSDRQRLALLGVFGARPDEIERFTPKPGVRLPTRRLLPSSNAGRGAPGTDPTRFQAAVLWQARDLGDVGPGCIDEIARRVGSSTSGVGLARHALHRFGLIDEFGAPTETGLAFLREDDPPIGEPARVACAA